MQLQFSPYTAQGKLHPVFVRIVGLYIDVRLFCVEMSRQVMHEPDLAVFRQNAVCRCAAKALCSAHGAAPPRFIDVRISLHKPAALLRSAAQITTEAAVRPLRSKQRIVINPVCQYRILALLCQAEQRHGGHIRIDNRTGFCPVWPLKPVIICVICGHSVLHIVREHFFCKREQFLIRLRLTQAQDPAQRGERRMCLQGTFFHVDLPECRDHFRQQRTHARICKQRLVLRQRIHGNKRTANVRGQPPAVYDLVPEMPRCFRVCRAFFPRGRISWKPSRQRQVEIFHDPLCAFCVFFFVPADIQFQQASEKPIMAGKLLFIDGVRCTDAF